MKNAKKFKFWGSAFLLLLFSAAAYFVARQFTLPRPVAFGVTFSAPHTRYLGLDVGQVYQSMMDDLGVRLIRLPVYWNETERAPGMYDWSETDYLLNEAAKRGAKVTLVLGQKVPRWPECHIPKHLIGKEGTDEYEKALLQYLTAAVVRYRSHDALLRYQIENEPLFPFGKCPAPDLALLEAEIETVRRADSKHEIQLTVSGEQEPWLDLAGPADALGVSLYRVVWNRHIGPVIYPLPPFWYAFQGFMVKPYVNRLIISELQAEPWVNGGGIPSDLNAAYNAFSADRFRDHVAFARRTGFSEAYLWGVEWWYYLKNHGDSRLVDEARVLFHSSSL